MHDDVKDKYIQETRLISTMRFRNLLLISGILYLGFYLLDYYYYTQYSPAMFLSIRASICVLFLLMYLLSFNKSFQYHIDGFGQLAVFIGSMGISIMIYLTEGTESVYYQGLILMTIAAFLINAFSVVRYIILQIIILASYVVCALASSYNPNVPDFIQAMFFLVSSMVLMTFIVAIYSRQHRSEFEIRERLRTSQLKLSKSYDQVKSEVKYDELTSVFTRKYFLQQLNLKITEANLYNDNFFFIIFDIDHFKQINDEYGHLFGDKVLKSVISAVKRTVRDNTVIGRFGGDEFVMLFGHGTKDQIMNRLMTVSQAVSDLKLKHEGKDVKVSISIGISEFSPKNRVAPKELIENAEPL